MKAKIFLPVIGFFATIALVVHSLEDNPHKFHANECTICHEIGMQGNVVGTDVSRITEACTSCHSDLFENGYIHPVDTRPVNAQIAIGMPLSREGLMTCNTCHDIHAPHIDPNGNPSYFLRRYEKGKAFCNLCHFDDNGRKTGHKTLIAEAHLGAKYTSSRFGDPIDPLSKNCISCHDGSVGPSITFRTGFWRHSNKLLSHADGGHPIGINYEDARLRHGRKTDLRPIDQVDKRIKFFDGKIGCGTCHNPFYQKGSRLVMSNYRSRLCFACHAMDG